LPEEWLRLARIIDLTKLCETLTQNNLPEPIVAEVADLVRGTTDELD